MNMNFIKMALLGAVLSASTLFNPANASLIIAEGAIDDPTAVDVWSIEVITSGTFIFDVLAFESRGIDYFGNGEFNDTLDSFLYLFATDLSGALMGFNDDSGSSNDGSTSYLDSYMSLALNAGTYVLAIGDW